MSGVEAIPILTALSAVANVALNAVSVFRKKHLDVENTKTTEELWQQASEVLQEGIEQLQQYHEGIDIAIVKPLLRAWEDGGRRIRSGLAQERTSRRKKVTARKFINVVNERKHCRKAALLELELSRTFREGVKEASTAAMVKATILKRIEEETMSTPHMMPFLLTNHSCAEINPGVSMNSPTDEQEPPPIYPDQMSFAKKVTS